MKEYFNCNLNLITMFPKCVLVREETKKRFQRVTQNYLKDGTLEGYIPANELIKELGIGAVKLKRLFATIGEEPKYNRSVTYYHSKNLQQLKDILAESPSIKTIDKTGFISTQELMQLFNFTTDKAFNIILNHNMNKIRFGGNVNYYDKDSAIEIFTKYKKN